MDVLRAKPTPLAFKTCARFTSFTIARLPPHSARARSKREPSEARVVCGRLQGEPGLRPTNNEFITSLSLARARSISRAREGVANERSEQEHRAPFLRTPSVSRPSRARNERRPKDDVSGCLEGEAHAFGVQDMRALHFVHHRSASASLPRARVTDRNRAQAMNGKDTKTFIARQKVACARSSWLAVRSSFTRATKDPDLDSRTTSHARGVICLFMIVLAHVTRLEGECRPGLSSCLC